MAPAQNLCSTVHAIGSGLASRWASRWASRHKHTPQLRRWDFQDLIALGVIGGGGALVFMLFLWAHLGLSAVVVPPGANMPQQSVVAGPYRVQMTLDASTISAGREHLVTLTVADTSGRRANDMVVHVQPVMLSMPMRVPPATVEVQGDGRFRVRPIFSMAGSWQLDVTIAQPNQAAYHASFPVNVRWK